MNGLKEERAVSYLRQLMLAFQVLKTKEIMHRDIKAENLFLKENGRLVIGDFGFAKMGYLMRHTKLGREILKILNIITRLALSIFIF